MLGLGLTPMAGRVRAAIAIVLAGVLGLGLIALVRDGGVDCDGYRFDAAGWRDAHADPAGETDAGPAHRLAKELVECEVLSSDEKREVERLLGRPTRFRSTREQWHYELGHLGGTFNYDSLVIDFTDDRVSRVDIWENV
jgi:hypothetical protein